MLVGKQSPYRIRFPFQNCIPKTDPGTGTSYDGCLVIVYPVLVCAIDRYIGSMLAKFEFFAKDDTALGIDTSAQCREDRLCASQLEILRREGRSSSLIVDRLRCCSHKVSCDFIDIFGFDTRDLLSPLWRIFVAKNMLPVLFESLHIRSNELCIIEFFFEYHIGQCQHKCKICPHFDWYPHIRFGGRIGKPWIYTDQLSTSALGTLEDIHRIRCNDRLCPVGTCHDHILGIFKIYRTVAAEGQGISADSSGQADRAVVDKVERTELTFHPVLKGMLCHPLTCTVPYC